MQPITENEVLLELQNLNSSKIAVFNGIPIKFIKMFTLCLSPILTKLFNISIQQCTFSDILKIAELVPIHKRGSKYECSNYLFYDYQFGFTEKLFTELAVNQISEEFINNVENKQINCSLFLDLKEAFDTVDHKILLNKLYQYAIGGMPLKFFTSYLISRQQYSVINRIKSSSQLVKCGVPQGSTLGRAGFTIWHFGSVPGAPLPEGPAPRLRHKNCKPFYFCRITVRKLARRFFKTAQLSLSRESGE